MKNITLVFVGLSLCSAIPAFAAGPCKDKREAKHSARKGLHECIQSWTKEAAEATDDCSSKLQAFVTAARDVKSCVDQEKASREKEKAERQAAKKAEKEARKAARGGKKDEPTAPAATATPAAQ